VPARGRVWQGVPSAGGRGAGLAATGIGGRGDVERLRRDAGAGSCLRGQSLMNICLARARETGRTIIRPACQEIRKMHTLIGIDEGGHERTN